MTRRRLTPLLGKPTKINTAARRATDEMAQRLAQSQRDRAHAALMSRIVQETNTKRISAGPSVSLASNKYPTVADTLENDSVLVSAPTNRGNVSRAPRPSLQYNTNGNCVISHREFIRDLPSSTAFTATEIALNPGLNGSFPWLSRIAANYESYIFRKLRVHYQTECGTAAIGTVILTIDYDAGDTAPSTKMQALSYRGAVRSAPWSPCVHTSLQEDLSKRKTYFCRAGGLKTGQDVTLYDTGNLYLITVGQAAGVVMLGEIWLEYVVELKGPKALSAGGGNAIWGVFNVVDRTNMAVVADGNLPAVSVTTNPLGTNSEVTFTFSQPWTGGVAYSLNGSGFANAGVLSGTAQRSNAASLQSGGSVVGLVHLDADQGETLVLTITNTTVTSGGFNFTQGFGAFN